MPDRSAETIETVVQLSRSIDMLAGKFCRLAPFLVERDDLEQEGWLAALEALPNYDASRGTSRLTWATNNALRGMQHHLRREARLRGISAASWEAGEGVNREVSLDAAARLGRDGIADSVALRTTVEAFAATLDGMDARIVAELLGGTDGIWRSMAQVGLSRSGTNAIFYRKRLRRKFEAFLRLGTHQEEAVL